MKIEEKFNKRSAELIEVQQPLVDEGPHFALGIRVRNVQPSGADGRILCMHLTPDEAMGFARDLIEAVRRRTKG